jgi:hypothetical protein
MELARTGSPLAEEFLGASGEEAVPWLLRLLESTDPDVRRRARGLLLSLGHELTLTPADEVDLILFDLTRQERHAFAGLRAIERLRTLGASAIPALRQAAAGSGKRAEVARRLLSSGAIAR